MVDLKHALVRIRTLRIISLVISFILLNAVLFGLEPQPLLPPVLQSSGSPASTVGDPFAVMQYMFYEAVFPWLPLASFLISAVLLGRMLCGWVCPFGFIQEILGFVKRKHREVSPRANRDMIYLKYGILGIVLFLSVTVSAATLMGIGRAYKDALGIFAQAPFNALSPHDTLFALLPTMISTAVSSEAPFADILGGIAALPPLFWVRLIVLGLVIAFAFYVPRSFCRYLCPVGAIMALLNHFSFLGLERDVLRCTKEGCRSCVDVCPMRVPILDLPWKKFTHPECIYCLECVDACSPTAIKPKFP